MKNPSPFTFNMRPVLPLLFLSISGTFLIVSAQMFLNLDIRMDVALTGTAMIFGIYTINRYTDVMEDFVNDTKKAIFFKEKQYIFKLGIAAIASSILYVSVKGQLNLYHFILLTGGITYSYSLIPWYSRKKGLQMIRLKEIFIVKNLVVSCLWGVSIFAFPLAAVNKLTFMTHPSIAMVVAGLCFSTFFNSLFNDILDRAGDRVAGSKTLATILGEKTSYQIIATAIVLWQAVVIAGIHLNWLSLPIFIFLTVLNLFPLAYILPTLMDAIDNDKAEFIAELDLPIMIVGLGLLAFL